MAGNALRYFTLDCHMDDSIKLLESEFGLKGFAVIIKLYQKIYSDEGYYCKWNRDVELLFAASLSTDREPISGNFVSEVIKGCLRREVFDKGMYERYGILTSRGIQNRYLEAARRRTSAKLINEYLLVKVDPKFKNVSIISKNVDIFEKNVSNSRQRKVKESKEEKSNLYSPADAEQIIESTIVYLNKKVGSDYKADAKRTVSMIVKLLSRGYTAEDMKKVIDKKHNEWKGTEYAKYLRPSTLFGEKFDEYLNQIPVKAAPMTKFHNFEQHKYESGELEKLFINN